MPEPVRSNQRYLPGLDGLRALAVGAVVAYHIGFGWAQGGLLGVGVFFTLSGYLITDLLLCQQEMTGGLQFADFWLRRARRLLPALFLMLAVVVAWVTLLERSLLPAIRGAVAASALYVNNWWLIAQHSSYFAQFGPPSPVGHLWSLAVEEQFYLIWPWLLWIGLRLRRGRSGTNTRLAAASLLLAAASAVTLVLASCGMAGVVQPNSANPTGGTPSAAVGTRSPPARTATGRSRVPARGPARTMCRAVVHIGDSTSDGLISPDYLPNPQERIAAQYERVGVTKFIPEISGARSIVETYHGQPNAYTVAQQLIQQGYLGCWVLALGTNDTADVAVGSPVSLATRIKQMMSLIGNQPVMWVNVKSLLASGPYAENNMLLWNRALIRACASYPNMRVYDWAAAVKTSWFISDGIHYTSAGYAARAYLIARALATAFPDLGPRARSGRAHRDGAGQASSCLVR